ncbi:hypothetical protein TSMEX_003301, partial [Taenia solium]
GTFPTITFIFSTALGVIFLCCLLLFYRFFARWTVGYQALPSEEALQCGLPGSSPNYVPIKVDFFFYPKVIVDQFTTHFFLNIGYANFLWIKFIPRYDASYNFGHYTDLEFEAPDEEGCIHLPELQTALFTHVILSCLSWECASNPAGSDVGFELSALLGSRKVIQNSSVSYEQMGFSYHQ